MSGIEVVAICNPKTSYHYILHTAPLTHIFPLILFNQFGQVLRVWFHILGNTLSCFSCSYLYSKCEVTLANYLAQRLKAQENSLPGSIECHSNES